MGAKETIKKNIWTIVFVILIVILTVIVIMLMTSFIEPEGTTVDKVGGVFVGYIDDEGWNENHYEGIKNACDNLGISFMIQENVSEDLDACRRAVDKLVKGGCNVIFLTSNGFGEEVYPVVNDHPEVNFYTISPESEPRNMTTYYGRMYQMRYLSGILAASYSKSGILGFVAAMSTPQVDRCINAFLLGARSVNPDAEVLVAYSGSWFDPAKEEELARRLIEDGGADVITEHTSVSNAARAADEMGIYSIGYNTKLQDHSDKYLGTLVFHWETMYNSILGDYTRGNVSQLSSYWWGSDRGVVDIEDLSPVIDRETISLIDKTEKRFAGSWDVFLGEIHSNDGRLRCHANERISDSALMFDMTWLAEGVTVYEH